MYRHLIDLVNRLGRPRLGVVGDLMLDRYVFGDAERISPEAPIQVLRVVSQECRLGGAGSVVNNLRALGADVSVFSVVGRDDVGRQVMDGLKAAGARTSGVVRLAGRPTTVKTRFVGRAQHRIPQQVLRVDEEQVAPIPAEAEDRLLAGIRKGLGRFQAVLLGDYNKGVLTPRLTQAIIRAARRRRVPVLVDPIKDRDYAKYRGATLLTPNRLETEMASGQSVARPEALRRAAGRLLKNLRLDAIIVTLDKDGAYLALKGRKGQMVPTRPRRVYDNAGAGDMVISVVALIVAAGGSLPDAVRLGNVAGGLEVEKFGVQTVSREEIVGDLLGEARRAGDKLRSLENLLVDLNRHRAQGETVVFTNGCFDLVHAGHVAFFEFAGARGDVLVVGLNSDLSVRAIKGAGRPICSEKERVKVLAALEAVDYIVLFDEETPERIIRTVRPDVLVKGEDWRAKGVVGRRSVESSGGRVVLAPLLEGLSTTELMRRIRRSHDKGPA
ncbi:MAG: bifunctional heptose 7-phosphate kinase/heptose 1-phosphate adenyltransferase [Phycisphaerae bacterium]